MKRHANAAGTLQTSVPDLEQFEIKVPRGINLLGLFYGHVLVVPKSTMCHLSDTTWSVATTNRTLSLDMTKAYITQYSKNIFPFGGNRDNAIDTILLKPSTIALRTDAIDASGNDVGDVATGWNVRTGTAFGLPGTTLGGFGVIPDGTNNTNVLQVDFPARTTIWVYHPSRLTLSSRWKHHEQRRTSLGDPDLHDLVFSVAGPVPTRVC